MSISREDIGEPRPEPEKVPGPGEPQSQSLPFDPKPTLEAGPAHATNCGPDVPHASPEDPERRDHRKNPMLIHCPHPGCERVFTAVAHLKTHEFSHINAKPNKCPYCGKSYSQVRRLESHMLTHVATSSSHTSRPRARSGSSATSKGVAKSSPRRRT
ncbi:MAG: C2H2-type zinc finger protein [Candidatus Pacebacteria bacterium]|nr:C2H2-type zinc finger protein [Candidatus Paceibacterota bacterium]